MMFDEAVLFTDIHFGMKNNSRQHNDDCEQFIYWMIDEAHQRFDFYQAKVIHRVGELRPADQIVLVAVTSAHRGESFKACEFLMDYLKTIIR